MLKQVIENASKTNYRKSSILFFVVKNSESQLYLIWKSEKGRVCFGCRRFQFRLLVLSPGLTQTRALRYAFIKVVMSTVC